MNTEFNENYKIARAMWIDKRLKELPNVRFGKKGSNVVVREYTVTSDGKRSNREYFSYHKEYGHLSQVSVIREKLIREQKRLGISNPQSQYGIKCVGKFAMTDEKWNSIRSSCLDNSDNSEYNYNGIKMRSRFEVLTAEILGSLDLDFKYEARMTIGGTEYFPDFLVYLPEFGMCFVIECLGMVDDFNYALSNSSKLTRYINNGMVIGRDLLILVGGKNYLPDPIFIKNCVIRAINGIADDSLYFLQ
ncbi:MAG: hypothetical protein MJ094_01135 [Saccharofermentans sp.]|nr:hypothetical protein [Saccharofermentans sp.]